MPISPAVAHHRAKIAAKSRVLAPDDPELATDRRDLRAANVEAYITKVLAERPPLTDEQRTRLAELLRPVRRVGAA
ncbi:hypothetical protein KIH27_08080 [Mycobacterium sp. M1]|uniref:PhiRv1 phage protein n=1 Tax=Mycolicibacter acidiphilus TaxID=2835306 RepID=A0ABS5RGX3_9MYCO|nr:hypothetical protein [Mycolicibacter acidiphilus]MBS9533545.1 hypothetical protein [Mycolicibacter acidiphilus]